jgi:ubiquinone biosynthesis protein
MIRPLKTLQAYRRLRRYRQVTVVLVKYGFGDVVDRLGSGTVRAWVLRRRPREISTAQRLRMALAELGPTFVKFGQLLSTRPDILPEHYINELERLQDEVPPFPYPQVETIFMEDLGKPPGELFAVFEQTPFASGSIAQVHRARLESGRRLAVKLQRPGIPSLIETDLAILAELASLAEKHVPELRWFRPVDLVEQFARTIRRELDFVAEAQAIERFRRNFEGDPARFVPALHWQYTTSRILTTDYVDGVKVTHLEELEARGYDRKAIARNGARVILKEVFEHRLFHADPHPGNFFVLEGNVIAAVDFGIVGRLDDETAEQLGLLFTAVVQKDSEEILRVFRNLKLLHQDVDVTLLRVDIEDFLDQYHGLPLEKVNTERMIEELLRMVRRHRIILPVNLALLGRMLAVSSGVGRMLDPEFNIIEEARPFVRSFLAARLDPKRTARKVVRAWRDYQAMLRALPRDLEELAAKLKRGEVLVSLHHEGLNRFILEMDRSSNRLAFGMIVAALIVGSSLIIQLQRGPMVFGFSALGLVGYLIAGLLGLWLVVAILRSGRI